MQDVVVDGIHQCPGSEMEIAFSCVPEDLAKMSQAESVTYLMRCNGLNVKVTLVDLPIKIIVVVDFLEGHRLSSTFAIFFRLLSDGSRIHWHNE